MVGATGAAGAAAAAELQDTHRRHRWRTGTRRSYRLHSGGSGGGLETSRSSAGGGPEPADIEGARSRSHGPAGRIGQRSDSESRSLRTAGLGQPAGPRHSPRDVGRSRLDRVEGGGDNGKPGRKGRHPRLAVTRVLICAVGAQVITPRDIISHRFTLSLFKGLSRDQLTNLRSSYNGRLHNYI
jgi:hypothetical protein